jgi:hypothetical protein
MLSLPTIAPRDVSLCFIHPSLSSHCLILHQHLLYKPTLDDGNNGTATQQSSSNHIARRPTSSAQTLLAELRADEHIIELRKFNLMRFGAGWLRPPGVTKTLQSKLEEAQEQLEQIETQRRDAELRAQEEAAQQVGGTGMQDVEGGGLPDQEERDLDANVPDADLSAPSSDDDIGYITNVTFNEASLLQGSPSGVRQTTLEMEEAELDGRLQDERDLGVEGDLDDNVPEAGSYEHTDTELEDDSSDDNHEHEQARQPLSQARPSTRSDGRARMSLLSEDSELLVSSSFVESSPALARRAWRGSNAFLSSGNSIRGSRPPPS